MKQLEERKKRAADMIQELKKLFPNAKTVLKFSNNLELLIAVMLSAQCTDRMVNKVTEKLFKKYKKLDEYVKADPKEFERDIHSCGFYKNKTKNILTTVKMLKKNLGGRFPTRCKACCGYGEWREKLRMWS